MQEHRCECCGARVRPDDGKVCRRCIARVKRALARALRAKEVA